MDPHFEQRLAYLKAIHRRNFWNFLTNVLVVAGMTTIFVVCLALVPRPL